MVSCGYQRFILLWPFSHLSSPHFPSNSGFALHIGIQNYPLLWLVFFPIPSFFFYFLSSPPTFNFLINFCITSSNSSFYSSHSCILLLFWSLKNHWFITGHCGIESTSFPVPSHFALVPKRYVTMMYFKPTFWIYISVNIMRTNRCKWTSTFKILFLVWPLLVTFRLLW